MRSVRTAARVQATAIVVGLALLGPLGASVATVSAGDRPAPSTEGRSVVAREESAGADLGRPGVTLDLSPRRRRSVVVSGPRVPLYPTVELTCDHVPRTLVLERAEQTTVRTVLVYEVPPRLADVVLRSAECRLFLPGDEVVLSRALVWEAWAHPAQGRPPTVVLGRVVRVLDGGTVVARIGDREEIVRYIGVAAPRLQNPPLGMRYAARQATEINDLLAGRQAVRLELDAVERDPSGHLLAYVFVGERMVNEEMVRRGWAYAQAGSPNVRHREVFARLEREARTHGRGLWGESPDETERAQTLAVAAPGGTAARRGVAPLADGSCPVGHPVRADFHTYTGERCIFHPPSGKYYGVTKSEWCYVDEQEAREDGCRRSLW